MIRRGFWLAAGAVVGVTGYRKAARLGRELTGQSRPSAGQANRAAGILTGPALPRLTSPAAAHRRGNAATAIAAVASAAGFVRDVREGMADYRDLHRGHFDRNLGSQSDLAGPDDRQPGRES